MSEQTCCGRQFATQEGIIAHQVSLHGLVRSDNAEANVEQKGTVESPLSNPAAIVVLLQSALIDLYDLSITGKAKHWSVQGGSSAMEFLSIHRALDEIIDFAREQYDTCAERIVQLGGFPDGRAATIADNTPLLQVEPGPLTPLMVVRQVVVILKVLSARFESRMSGSSRDLVTQNLFIEISTGLQKFGWFWQASDPQP